MVALEGRGAFQKQILETQSFRQGGVEIWQTNGNGEGSGRCVYECVCVCVCVFDLFSLRYISNFCLRYALAFFHQDASGYENEAVHSSNLTAILGFTMFAIMFGDDCIPFSFCQ